MRTCAVNREHSWQKMHPHSRQWCRRTKTENGTCEAFPSLPLGLTPRRLPGTSRTAEQTRGMALAHRILCVNRRPASLPRTVYRRTDGAKPLVG